MDDVVIVGGGIIGAATAYFLSKEGRKVKVIERDPTYKNASFPLSLGGFRRQFFQKENILLGKFAREFIFQIPELLKTEKNPKPTASMVTNGYLLMFGPEHAEEQYKALENHKACEAGTKNIKGSELSKFFPYINSDGIETATFTDNQSEGWIDPFMFHGALKSKAIELGAEFEARARKARYAAVMKEVVSGDIVMTAHHRDDQVETLSADFASTISSRQLEDDAMVNFRMSGGTVGRLWTSSVAIGRQHGFEIQIFGETGGLKWFAEQPNQLIFTPLGGRTQIIEKGEGGLSEEATRLSRVAIAHPEGFPLAVANMYCDLADALRGKARDGLPSASDGVRSMAAVHAAVTSANNHGAWTDARPPMFR